MPARSYPVSGPLDLRRTLGAAVARARRPDDPPRRRPRLVADPDAPTGRRRSRSSTSVPSCAPRPGARAPNGLLDGPAGHAGARRRAGAHPGRVTRSSTISPVAPRASGSRASRAVLESLVPAILEQKVTGQEARRAWPGLIRVHGEPAPGPPEWRLRLGPAPATLAALPYYAYHPFGVEQRRADLIRRVAARAAWFEAIVDLPLAEAYARLTAVPGIGPWTAAEVGVRALGDEDAVSVGDFHLPNLVAYALAGEPRGTDARMLELLEPYRGQRARVVRLLELSGVRAPRYGPRLSGSRIEDR